jgi:hypothetical protein
MESKHATCFFHLSRCSCERLHLFSLPELYYRCSFRGLAGSAIFATGGTPARHRRLGLLRPDIGAWAFIGAIIGARHFRRPFPGAIFCGYLAGYGVWRGFVETFRGDSAHSVLGMTVSQVISIGLIAIGLMLYLLFWKRNRKIGASLPDTGEAEMRQNIERKTT